MQQVQWDRFRGPVPAPWLAGRCATSTCVVSPGRRFVVTQEEMRPEHVDEREGGKQWQVEVVV